MLSPIRKYSRILFLALAGHGRLLSEIRTIDSLAHVDSEFQKIDSTTLVVFDIDKTLTNETNVFRQKWFREIEAGKQFWQEVQQFYGSKPNSSEFKAIVESKRMKSIGLDQPVESITVPLIKTIQQSGAKVIALTACQTGKFGLIDSMEEWRFEQLANVGIDFSSSFSAQKIILDAISDRAGRHPVFYKGIILSEEDSIEKGIALGAFLDCVGFRPGKVIFFDDKLSNVQSVQAEMDRRSIPFIGYEYRGAEKMQHRYKPAVLECQLNHMKKYDEFISDEAAENLLQ